MKKLVVMLIGSVILLTSCAVPENISPAPSTPRPTVTGTSSITAISTITPGPESLPTKTIEPESTPSITAISTITPGLESLPTETAEPESTPLGIGIVITATVMDTSLSARVIMLQEPVEGFSVVALTDETELVSQDGSPVALKEFQHGVQIRAIGKPGSSGALLAEQIVLLGH